MRIGIIGASGKAGNLILKEAVDRDHEVTAIVRNAGKIENKEVDVLEKNIFDLKKEDLQKFNVVVNAFNAPHGEEQQHIEAGRVLIEALKGTDTRVLVVGGAGSLYVDKEEKTRLFDTPDFPEAYLPTATNMGKSLEEFKKTEDVKWTHLSPAAFFDPAGKRTGEYKTGGEQLILNNKGESYISYEDYAIAVVDEIENPKHIKQRFSVVGEAQ
ncbi:NAD(P)-dependent oxidoreductase [Priestia filamentosa]|uniref:Uncharacterized protein n=1 Tax=Priestia filamentosa TaxID=1402861 RepID=A0A0H4KEM7_9BACI|nr:NAD(P)-dependent oxidoreductase [Priestia filamentosa]AKO92075.1 hypothetical protein BEH_08160 [Priestia filamentosa]MDT3762079.1 NAD(P)-dependent oxidoreductase [Priestia filamentosa]OXS65940.1 hypothetical protein B1B01_21060 [Priestia filamentosa]RJS64642.1 NAD(P)-dependent oxidoreductase [Priestia filamentosa]WCM17166.1 NAD(P)-dependent oxidoreductase [Priestia filamentosa]